MLSRHQGEAWLAAQGALSPKGAKLQCHSRTAGAGHQEAAVAPGYTSGAQPCYAPPGVWDGVAPGVHLGTKPAVVSSSSSACTCATL